MIYIYKKDIILWKIISNNTQHFIKYILNYLSIIDFLKN